MIVRSKAASAFDTVSCDSKALLSRFMVQH
jgi:hypothetical protein